MSSNSREEEVGEMENDLVDSRNGGEDQIIGSEPTGEVLEQELREGSVEQEIGSVEEIQEEKESKSTGEVLGDITEDNSGTQIIIDEKKEEAVETQPFEESKTDEKVLEEGIRDSVEKREGEYNEPMEVDLNCANNADIGIESENIWGDEMVVEDSRNELTVHDFLMVEAKEVAETSVEAEIQSNIELDSGERTTIEEDNTKTVKTNPEHKDVVYHRKKHATKPTTQDPDSSETQIPSEEIPIEYNLPSIDKGDFVISDLVWGKVKSHPWWPGLIISPSDASNLAMKYQKRDSFLVAFLGDKTFAWCDEYQLKPFFPNFSHFEKQTSSDAFNNALKSVLSEVSRRFEVGTICPCLDVSSFVKEVYPKIENAGVKQGFDNCTASSGEIVNYFNSEGIIGFVKNLAMDPYKGTNDKLGQVMVTSLIKSFYRSKGYSIHPKYQTFGPLEDYVEPVIPSKNLEIAIIDEVDTIPLSAAFTLTPHNPPNIFTPVILHKKSPTPAKEIITDQPVKRKRGRPPKKKKEELDLESQKPLSELIHRIPNGSKSNNNKPDMAPNTRNDDSNSSFLSLPWNKQKATVDFNYVDQESKSQTPPSSGFGVSFKIGACISRAASRLTGSRSGSQPIIPMPKFDNADFDVSSDDGEMGTPKENYFYNNNTEERRERKRRLKKYHYSDPEEILSQLYILAMSPMKEYIFLGNVVGFFTDFRKFIVPDPVSPSVPVSEEPCTVPERFKAKRGRKRKVDIEQAKVDLEQVRTGGGIDNNLQDSYWSDMILCGQTEEPSVWPKVYKRRASIETKSTNLTGPDAKRALVLLASSNRPVIRVEEKRLGECNPTALILSFGTRYGAVPSEMELVRIFSRYGALKGEMEKEMKERESKVTVVFKRRADADMAFGSLRKQNVFGPSLMSYRLVGLDELEKKAAVPNGEDHAHLDVPGANTDVPAQEENPVVTSDVEAVNNEPISETETSVYYPVEVQAQMVAEIPTEPSHMVQDENADQEPFNTNNAIQTEFEFVTEMSNEPSGNVQTESHVDNEISNDPAGIFGEENQIDQTSIEVEEEDVQMETYPSSPVRALGDEMTTGSLKTVQEKVVFERSSGQAEIENEKPFIPSENNIIIPGEIENEQTINPSESSIQGEAETKKTINPPESDIQGEAENEKAINLSESNIQLQEEIENEKAIDPAGTEGQEVDDMAIDQPNDEEEEVIGEMAINPASTVEGKIADEEEGLIDNKTEQGEIFGDDDDDDDDEEEEEHEQAQEENFVVSSGVQAVDPEPISEAETSVYYPVETEAHLVTEIPSEIPMEPSITVQDKNADQVPSFDTNNAVQTEFEFVTGMPSEHCGIVQTESQIENEISSDSAGIFGEENKIEETSMEVEEDVEMGTYPSSPVRAGGDEITTDSLKTVQEEVVVEEGSMNPLESSSVQGVIENERPIIPSETSIIQAEIADEKQPINPSESSIQGQINNEKPINLSESSIQLQQLQGEIENEKANDPSGTEGQEVADVEINQPNDEEGGVVGDMAINPASTEEGEIADEEEEGLMDDKTEQGEIFGDDEEDEEEHEQGEIVGNEGLSADEIFGDEQGEIVRGEQELSDEEPEQGELTGDEPEQGELAGEESMEKHEEGEISGEDE